ncbi:MAG: M3 family oligoendopeptidase [Eubacteriales bacterium]|nr:M3 family oligoendopeptidase [Eubacteriales bacterium]
MKFSDMPYSRPDFEAQFSRMKDLLKQMEEAKNEEAFLDAMLTLDREGGGLQTQATLAHIRHTINTKDPFYSAENDVMDENLPRFEEIPAEAARITLSSPYKDAVVQQYGPHMLEKMAVQMKAFSPAIVEDLVEESKLATEYQKLIASAQIDFEGEKRNLSGLLPFMQSTDRDMRQRAFTAHWGWLAERSGELDSIYDKLVKVRHRIGKKLGFDSFIPVAYARMGRTDWDMEDARAYRKQIVESVVPLAQKLYRQQAKRIGIPGMKAYDLPLEYLSGNPLPQGGEDYLVEKARAMYKALSPETDEFFSVMTGQGLMDLTTKPGKAGGGYMTFIRDYKVPFIFSNFNGTSGDVDVLTHEAGHAFQGYLQRDVFPSMLKDYTMEVAEIHSMSMEFFAHPWMEGFFGPDTEKYFHSHVADGIKFLPYGASVDAFQEWVYLNPDATPQERNKQYREIEKVYLPHLDYSGFPYLQGGARWQKQSHIYSMPFYYLDYTLSQVCAHQYFIWNMKDPQAAWQSYLNACRRAGRIPFTALLKECGLNNPFEPGTIARITPELEAYMDGLDKSKIH